MCVLSSEYLHHDTDTSLAIIKFNETLDIIFNILNYLQFYKTVLIMYIREYNTVEIFDASWNAIRITVDTNHSI